MESGFAIKDIISIAISVAALSISCLSFYLNSIYKKYSLVCAIASWRWDEDPDEKFATCQIVISNNGNRSLSVRAIHINYANPSASERLPDLEPEELPAILKAGEQKIVLLNIPKPFLGKAEKNTSKLKFTIEIYTLAGQLRVAEKEFMPATNVAAPNSDDWKPFIMKKIGKT